MIPFGDLGLVLSYGRGIGKTYNMIKHAVEDSYIITCTEQHAKHLKDEIRKLDRNDLKVIVARDDNLKGISGIFYPDHWAIQHWLNSAAYQLSDYKQIIKDKDKEIARLQKESDDLVSWIMEK